MKKETTYFGLLKDPAVQVYLLGCLMGLGLVCLAQMARGEPILVLLVPVMLVVGLLGIFARFSPAPLLLLVIVTGGELYTRRWYYYRSRPWLISLLDTNPLDWLLCLGVLGYFLCQFRLQTLMSNIFPRDPRHRGEPAPGRSIPYRRRRKLVQRRASQTITVAEVVLALALLPVWTLLALLLLFQLHTPPSLFGLEMWQCRLLMAAWVLFFVLLLARGTIGYWKWSTWSKDEALMVLQETYWRETRREQRRQYRWLAWARQRGKYRRGTP
jgi:hypothetical protein